MSSFAFSTSCWNWRILNVRVKTFTGSWNAKISTNPFVENLGQVVCLQSRLRSKRWWNSRCKLMMKLQRISYTNCWHHVAIKLMFGLFCDAENLLGGPFVAARIEEAGLGERSSERHFWWRYLGIRMYCSNGVTQEVLLLKNWTGSKAKAKVSLLALDNDM